jgi:Na+-transporting NADH:ubiquinone oxidoreductase subunit NqrB
MERVDDQPQGLRVVYATLSDPRWFQIAFLGAFTMFALHAPSFVRNWEDWSASIATCVALDVFLQWIRTRTLVVPVSGLISGLGLVLLCDSPNAWTYAICGGLSILSKNVIRFRGRHIFNPTCFGIVACLFFLPQTFTVVVGRWGGSVFVLGAVGLLGCVVVWRAHRLDVSATWVITFVLGAAVRAVASGVPFRVLVGPLFGAAFQLFTFFMISDPKTTPDTRRGRILWSASLGALDCALRYEHLVFSAFYALFIMNGLIPVFRRIFVPATPEVTWRTKVWQLASGASESHSVAGGLTK